MKLDIDYNELAIKIGYSYLNGDYGYWEDGSGNLLNYDSMNNKRLESCINFVNKGIIEINNDKNGVIDCIERYLKRIIKNVSEKDIEYAKEQIVLILDEKKKELEDYMKKRKSFL